jgi:elongation factor 1-beta
MAEVIITMRLMPESPEVNWDYVYEKVDETVKKHGGEIGKKEEKPVAFGLKALEVIFVVDESSGSTEALEEEVSKIQGIESVEITDVRRALG